MQIFYKCSTNLLAALSAFKRDCLRWQSANQTSHSHNTTHITPHIHCQQSVWASKLRGLRVLLCFEKRDRGWAYFWEITPLWPPRRRRWGRVDEEEKRRILGIVAALSFSTQLSLSVSPGNPLLFCLKFLIGAVGQKKVITSHSEKQYSLLIK